jgi:hypothetical protein
MRDSDRRLILNDSLKKSRLEPRGYPLHHAIAIARTRTLFGLCSWSQRKRGANGASLSISENCYQLEIAAAIRMTTIAIKLDCFAGTLA